MRSTNDNSMDWLESCKQSLKVKNEKEAQTPKNDSTNSIDCLNNMEKESCELSSKILKTDKKEKIYTINDIIDEKHLASNEKNKNFTPIQNSSTSITNDITSTLKTKPEKPGDIDFIKTEEQSLHDVSDKNTTKTQQPRSTKNNDLTTEEKDDKKVPSGKRKRVTAKSKEENEEESDTKKVKVSKKAAASKGKRF